jgi:tRNA dimethylallyltransferase
MVEMGWAEEVRRLLDMGYGPELKSMMAIGYKEMVRHVLGRAGLDETVAEIAKQTRRLAKRLMTWFQAQPDARWVAPKGTDSPEASGRLLEPAA